MVLLSLHGLPAAQIAVLLDCHPATVHRWISRFNDEGLAGLADRPRSGRPRLGGRQLTSRITAQLARPGPWTLPRIRRYLGWSQVSPRTLYRRVQLVAIWRRPKLTARGDPDHAHGVAGIVARLIALPCRAVVLAEDGTHLNLLPHARASWTLRGARPQEVCWRAAGPDVRALGGGVFGPGAPFGPALPRGFLSRFLSVPAVSSDAAVRADGTSCGRIPRVNAMWSCRMRTNLATVTPLFRSRHTGQAAIPRYIAPWATQRVLLVIAASMAAQ
jgi:hypothetical protein